MRRSIIPLLLLLLIEPACTASVSSSDDLFLERCFGAVRIDQTIYRLRFEAVVFYATEGGIFAESSRCPDATVRLAYMSQDTLERFYREIGRPGDASASIGGVRGEAEVTTAERPNGLILRVRVRRLLSLSRMSDADLQAFTRRHHIGR